MKVKILFTIRKFNTRSLVSCVFQKKKRKVIKDGAEIVAKLMSRFAYFVVGRDWFDSMVICSFLCSSTFLALFFETRVVDLALFRLATRVNEFS
jgi:hypothetical protein